MAAMTFILTFVEALRPRQWTKNLLLLAGLIFGGHVAEFERGLMALLGFLVFCGLSGAVYLCNDLVDIEGDRIHPRKCHRPLASGRLSTRDAKIGLVLISTASLVCAWILGIKFFGAAAAYLIMMLLYSAILKHVVILDLFVVAGGFVLRAVAGILAVEMSGENLAITAWFLGCLFFGAFLIVVCKRRNELIMMNLEAEEHRPVLRSYTLPLLDQMATVTASACVVCYSLYAIVGPVASRPLGWLMIPSILLVLFGLFRYLYLVYVRNEGGAPENVLIRDLPVLLTVMLWLILVSTVYTVTG
jgi:4-hydroxybenzoate polyprenyltransferase